MNEQKKYLNLVPFSKFEIWDVKHYFRTEITSKYKVEKLENHIINETRKIKLEEDNKKYGILGISNETGMFDAYEEYGKNIKQPYKIVKNGFIAYNPYRINVGSIGIKTDKNKFSLISPAYVVISCRETLLPEYLYIIMKSHCFNKIIKENTTGTVRQTLTIASLENLKIPVPPIDIQKDIVKIYLKQLENINKINETIDEERKNIENYIQKELGIIESNLNENKRILKTEKFSNMSRWDVWNRKNKYSSYKYKFSKLKDVVDGAPLYGANEKALKIRGDIRYVRITDINEDGTLGEDFVTAKKIEKKYLLNEDDFLIARSGNTVGKTLLYKEYMGKCIFAGYLIKFKLNKEKINPQYLLYYTKSKIYKAWIEENQKIFGQPNINGQEYLNSDIIVPPIEIQNRIAERIEQEYKYINKCKKEIEEIKNENERQFEEKVFG